MDSLCDLGFGINECWGLKGLLLLYPLILVYVRVSVIFSSALRGIYNRDM